MNNKIIRAIFVVSFAMTVLAQCANALTITRVSTSDVNASEYLAFNPFSAISAVTAKSGSATVEPATSVGLGGVNTAGAAMSYSRPAIRIPYRPSLRSTYRPPLY